MMRRKFYSVVVGWVIAVGFVSVAVAVDDPPEIRTYRWELTDFLPVGGLGGAFHVTLIGPTGGTVVNTRIIAEFVSADAWDAAGVHIFGFAPIGENGTPFDVTGADFGWSGVGNFQVVYDTDAINGPVISPLWSLHINELHDPYFGRFLKVRIELKVENLVADESCAGDLNGDRQITAADVQLFETGDCPTEGPCPADLNNDGVVTVEDRQILISFLGVVCPVAPQE